MNTTNESTMEMEQYDTLPIPPSEAEMFVEPFQLEASSEPSDSPETFEDDEVQQAEADNAPNAMRQLMEEAVEAEDTDCKEDEKRAAHEAAEHKRRKEWEARQQTKKAAEQEALRLIASLPEDAIITASMKKVEDGTERLTRRNMKLCVMEWIQTKCLDDPNFARMAMHPKKNMLNCFHYINRKAKDYIMQEMKDNALSSDNDLSPEKGIYGGDVPDELCYQWAEQYFQDPEAKEDQEEEEKFVPKPYISSSNRKNTKLKKEVMKTSKVNMTKKDTAADKEEFSIPGQLSIFDSIQEVSA